MSEGGPSDEFRAYLAPLAIDPGAARVAERWAGITAWAGKGTVAEIPPLISAMRGDISDEVRAKLKTLFDALVEADDTFNLVNGAHMVRLIAAAALDYAFTSSATLDTCASLAVVTSSWGNRAPKDLSVDILARAEAELDHIAALARDREQLGKVVADLTAPQLSATTPSLKSISEGTLDHTTAAGAFGEVLKAVARAFASHTENVKSTLESLANRLEQADEEVDVLWYVFGGTSTDAGASFSKLDPRRAAFFAAREIAAITSRPMRASACNELLRRCGAEGKKGSFVEAVEEMGAEWIAEYASGEHSPTLFPIHRALARYAALVEPGSWVAGWSKDTGVSADFEVTPTELALAFYRERILLEELS